MEQDKSKLCALVGTLCATLLLGYIPQFEGTILKGYKDPIGIVTACSGNTKSAILGKPYTKQECEDLLITDLLTHASGIFDCVDKEKLTTGQMFAAISFAFNVGVAKFCNSTFAYKLVSQSEDACAELSKWIYAGKVKLKGLIERRRIEREICEGKIG